MLMERNGLALVLFLHYLLEISKWMSPGRQDIAISKKISNKARSIWSGFRKTEEMKQIVTFQKLDSSGAKFKMKLASSIWEKQIKTMK